MRVVVHLPPRGATRAFTGSSTPLNRLQNACNEASPDSPSYHPQRFDKSRHRVFQVCSQHVSVPCRPCHYLQVLRNTVSILFQRGVYPADDFHMVKKYGQTVLVTQDLALENYLEK